MKWLLIACVLVSFATLAAAQNAAPDNQQLQDIATQVNKMRDAMAAQAQQLDAQHKKMTEQQQEIEKLRSQLSALQNSANASTPAVTTSAAVTVTSPQMLDAALHTVPVSNVLQETVPPKESPLSFRIGSTEFTPGGFIDFENVFRTTNSGSVITTNFAAIPFSNSAQGHLTEDRITAQFTRFNLKITGKYGANDVLAYGEMDFNGNDATNVFVTANSHTFRERLGFVDLRRHNWEFIGGQTWSWLTPNRTGIGAMPTDLALTYDEDGNAQVGIPYTRAAEIRAIYHPNDHWAAGIGIENPEQYTGFGTGEVILPNAFASVLGPQLDPTNTTNTAPNLMPDILSKITYDTDHAGRHFHGELTGLITSTKTTVQPVIPGPFVSNAAIGGGFGGAFNVALVKNFRVLVNGLYTDGGGRYNIGLAPSTVVKPDGSPSLVHSGSGLAGIEYQPTPKTLFGAYYGAMYAQRNFFLDTSAGAKPNSFIGFGGPGSGPNNNKYIYEPTFDWTQTFWRNPQYGAVTLITQTSYLSRAPWFVATGQPKNAHLVMVYTSLRYVLP